MDGQRFDDLSKALGAAGSRRGFIRVLAGAAAGALAGLLRAESSEGAGTCLQNGALCSTNSSCCSGFCDGATPYRPGGCATPTSPSGSGGGTTTSTQCGRMTTPCCPGNVCYDGSACSNGTCGTTVVCPGGCPAGSACCAAGCVNLASSSANCGTCGHVCIAPLNGTATCTGGVCGFACNTGFTKCGNTCCSSGTNCVNGTCASVCAPNIEHCIFVPGSCGVGNTCVCYNTIDGTTGCFSQPSCSGQPTCSSNSDCPAGSGCIVNYCCNGQGVCIPFCPSGAAPVLGAQTPVSGTHVQP